MPNTIIKSVLLFFMLQCSLSCNTKGVPLLSPDDTPKFGKVQLVYSDTNSAEFKKMIFQLDTFYNHQVAMGFNGSVLVGYKGKVLYERYFGVSQKESGARWSPETSSQLASTSKTLTSGAILLLKDKGLLKLDDPVANYLAGFPYPMITLRMLLDHRSGLPDYINVMPKPADKHYLHNDDIVQWFATKKPALVSVPNTKFRYCNTNFALLASVVENVTGMKFGYFMKRFFFDPIGMDHTFIINPEEERVCTASFCYNYKWQIEPDMHLDGVCGDKGAYSSVRDLYKWDQILYSGKLIKLSTLEEAYKPHNADMLGVKNYGLGWRMLNYPEGTKVIYHNGWWHGNNTCFYRFIQDNFTIIVLGNRFNKNIYRQPQHIYNIVMGQSPFSENVETEE